MTDPRNEELLSGFTPAVSYTREAVADAPRAAGVHVVLEGGVVIYVGHTRDLRARLRQHLTGNRESSVLHDQVGRELDKLGPVATAADVADWLGRREVRWRTEDNPEATKLSLVVALRPRFNRQIPKHRGEA